MATASNENVSTLTGEEFCRGEPDTLSTSGNDSHFPLQFTHRAFSLCWSPCSLPIFSLRALPSSAGCYAFDQHSRSIGFCGQAPANWDGSPPNVILIEPLVILIAAPHSRGIGLPPIGETD